MENKMVEERLPMIKEPTNHLMIKIEHFIRKTGFDEGFIQACQFHLKKILASQFDKSDMSDTDYNLLLSHFFFAKMDKYPSRKAKCQINEFEDWPLLMLPSEVFAENKIPVSCRKQSFYKCLRIGDFLDCKVASNLTTYYELQVIHKKGALRILEDLKIIVVMPKTETDSIQKEFGLNRFIRVVVSQITNDGDQKKVFVSLKDTGEESKKKRLPLGIITQDDLPKYVLNPSDLKISKFKDYLSGSQGFSNPILLNVYESLGIDPRGNYSFFPEDESLSTIDVSALLKESALNEVKQFADIALRELDKKACSYAMNSIELAIKMYSKHVSEKERAELYKLFEIRGRIHEESEKPKYSKDSIYDWVRAYNAKTTDYNTETVKVHLSKDMFLVTNHYYHQKDYRTAGEWGERCLKLNPNNVEARALMEYLKKHHPEAFENLDKESLLALQEKQREIVTALRRLKKERP